MREGRWRAVRELQATEVTLRVSTTKDSWPTPEVVWFEPMQHNHRGSGSAAVESGRQFGPRDTLEIGQLVRAMPRLLPDSKACLKVRVLPYGPHRAAPRLQRLSGAPPLCHIRPLNLTFRASSQAPLFSAPSAEQWRDDSEDSSFNPRTNETSFNSHASTSFSSHGSPRFNSHASTESVPSSSSWDLYDAYHPRPVIGTGQPTDQSQELPAQLHAQQLQLQLLKAHGHVLQLKAELQARMHSHTFPRTPRASSCFPMLSPPRHRPSPPNHAHPAGPARHSTA